MARQGNLSTGRVSVLHQATFGVICSLWSCQRPAPRQSQHCIEMRPNSALSLYLVDVCSSSLTFCIINPHFAHHQKEHEAREALKPSPNHRQSYLSGFWDFQVRRNMLETCLQNSLFNFTSVWYKLLLLRKEIPSVLCIVRKETLFLNILCEPTALIVVFFIFKDNFPRWRLRHTTLETSTTSMQKEYNSNFVKIIIKMRQRLVLLHLLVDKPENLFILAQWFNYFPFLNTYYLLQ